MGINPPGHDHMIVGVNGPNGDANVQEREYFIAEYWK